MKAIAWKGQPVITPKEVGQIVREMPNEDELFCFLGENADPQQRNLIANTCNLLLDMHEHDAKFAMLDEEIAERFKPFRNLLPEIEVDRLERTILLVGGIRDRKGQLSPSECVKTSNPADR